MLVDRRNGKRVLVTTTLQSTRWLLTVPNRDALYRIRPRGSVAVQCQIIVNILTTLIFEFSPSLHRYASLIFARFVQAKRVSRRYGEDRPKMIIRYNKRMILTPLVFAVWIVFACGGPSAQKSSWEPSPGQAQVPIWPGAVPDARPDTSPETSATTDTKELVAGKPWVYVSNVSRPTITVYSPKEKNTGAAVVVFPGGGYQILAIDLEGTEICDWLTSRGITAVLLKYRVPTERVGTYLESPLALQDAQRAVGLVRFHAAEWHIDPHKIGVIGFSAGGHMVAAVSTHFDKRSYPEIDAADKESCRPDFAMRFTRGICGVPTKTFLS